MRLPVEFIKDARMKAEFTAFLSAESPHEKESIVKEYNDWFCSLSPERQAVVIASRMESVRLFISGAQENLKMLGSTADEQEPWVQATAPNNKLDVVQL